VAPNIPIFLRNFPALAQEVAGRRPALEYLDAVHDRPFTL